jgi:MHS family proline/betaine transporter-like MFS transporter
VTAYAAGSLVHSEAARRNIVAGAIGSVLEWYDFAIYGYLAPILGKLFFPASDPVASLLAAFGVFAIGFMARPVGGVIFGYIGDKLGRKPALTISVVAMGASTFAIGIMPTDAQIGASAALCLVLLRIIAGLSVGGEFTGAIILLGEHAPQPRRAYYSVWPEVGCLIGFLLGSGIGAAASTLLGGERMLAWGWRVPFLLGGVIAVWGIVFRSQMTESPELSAARRKAPGAAPLAALIVHWRIIVRFVGLLLLNGVGFYTMYIYAASYLTEHIHVGTARALDINTGGLIVMLALVVPAALVSDRIGRKPLMYVATIGTFMLALPLWWLMHQHDSLLIFSGQAGFGALFIIGFASVPPLMSELLPPEIRCTSIGVAYNVSIGLFGGTSPLIVTYLVARTADDYMPAFYVMASALLSFIALLGLPETAGPRWTLVPQPK